MVRALSHPASAPALSADTAELKRLFFNYLRISPSYRLAAQAGTARITPRMPEHSKAALRCYKRFGDVWQREFEEWAGPALFPSGNPTRHLQALPPDAPYVSTAHRNVTLVVVPNELSSLKKVEEFRAIVAGDTSCQRLAVRPKTLWKNLAAVHARARYPDAELWRIGVLAGSVERYSGRIDPWCPRRLARDAAERRHLTLIVIRLLKHALTLAENAAVGLFPHPDPQPWQQLAFAFEDHRLDALLSEAAGDEHLIIRQKLALPCLIEPESSQNQRKHTL